MSLAQRWLRHPQSVWLRKALFQVHLWTGIALALYILIMSLTGTVLIYRRELSKAFSGEPRVLTIQDQSALPSGPFELEGSMWTTTTPRTPGVVASRGTSPGGKAPTG